MRESEVCGGQIRPEVLCRVDERKVACVLGRAERHVRIVTVSTW